MLETSVIETAENANTHLPWLAGVYLHREEKEEGERR